MKMPDAVSVPSQLAISIQSPHLRAINNEYFTALIAGNSQQLVEFKKAELRLQAQTAIHNAQWQDEALKQMTARNRSLDQISDSLGELSMTALRIADGLDHLDDTLREGFEAIRDTLRDGFIMTTEAINRAISVMEVQARTLDGIAETLRNPGATEVQELLREADKWQKLGKNAEGKDRLTYWTDALSIFQESVAHRMGRQNSFAWFYIGCLTWAIKNDHAEAENAFSKARVYSVDGDELWHTRCIRQEAETQYLQERFQDAFNTVARAVKVRREYDSLYTLARYAVRIGRGDEMVKLVDECMTMDPLTVVRMQSEPDFLE